MRCKNFLDCGNRTATPNRVECYKKFGKCRPCCINEGLVKMPKNGQIVRVTKASGTNWRKGKGQAFRKPLNETRKEHYVRQQRESMFKWEMICF